MDFRCEYCHSPLEIPEKASLDNVVCKACRRLAVIAPDDRTVSHYELMTKLGAGAYGTVWQGRDVDSDRLVAIKIAKPPGRNGTPSAHLMREVRLASQLNHPNIAQVYEAGREGEWQFIVSAFVEGQTLSQWLSSRKLSVKEATTLCISLASAMEYAHQRGVIHRDLKPSNIVMNAQDQPCIIDFGASKCVSDELTMKMERYEQVLFDFRRTKKRHADRSGPVIGTPQYMSPEQARGDAYFVDHRCDIYSLGVVFYELLTGKKAFRGTPERVLRKVLYSEPLSPRRIRRAIPRDIETICLKAMSKSPADRYDSAQAMADDCERALAGEPIVARRTLWLRRCFARVRARVN